LNLDICEVTWSDEHENLSSIRYEVFVVEQSVPIEEELDALDAEARHFLVTQGGELLATGRLLSDGRIGRMAVRKKARGSGVGREMLAFMIDAAHKTGITHLYLHSQTHAIGFYEKLGFKAHGDEFFDAGIPHVEMTLSV